MRSHDSHYLDAPVGSHQFLFSSSVILCCPLSPTIRLCKLLGLLTYHSRRQLQTLGQEERID